MDGIVGDDVEGRNAVEELCNVDKGGGGVIGKERLRFWKGGVTGKAVIQLANDGENSISELLLFFPSGGSPCRFRSSVI